MDLIIPNLTQEQIESLNSQVSGNGVPPGQERYETTHKNVFGVNFGEEAQVVTIDLPAELSSGLTFVTFGSHPHSYDEDFICRVSMGEDSDGIRIEMKNQHKQWIKTRVPDAKSDDIVAAPNDESNLTEATEGIQLLKWNRWLKEEKTFYLNLTNADRSFSVAIECTLDLDRLGDKHIIYYSAQSGGTRILHYTSK